MTNTTLAKDKDFKSEMESGLEEINGCTGSDGPSSGLLLRDREHNTGWIRCGVKEFREKIKYLQEETDQRGQLFHV